MSATSPAPGKDLLVTCSYVPEEIVLAAGFRPRRFLPEARPADAWIHPNTCGYVKNVLAAALDSEGLGAVGVVIANSCDAMRRLHDLWTGYVPRVPAFLLDVPKKQDGDSIAYFASELDRLAEWLQRELGGVGVTPENLAEALRARNRTRALMGELFGLQSAVPSGLPGTRVFDLCLAGVEAPGADFADSIRRQLSAGNPGNGGVRAPRIVVGGGAKGERAVIEELEKAGADVVALDTCIGLRHYHGFVDEASDPIPALARRYLTRRGCARMVGLERRIRDVRQLADAAKADGIVYCALKFCDSCLYDAPRIGHAIRELGLPLLWLEDDYGSASLGQTRTRIAAFLEMIEPDGGGARC
jgi:benzoyl-CoA reductase/2-hydroxyglutaryl-CoA dehydratase subunit BcrC/BadD/HgdB